MQRHVADIELPTTILFQFVFSKAAFYDFMNSIKRISGFQKPKIKKLRNVRAAVKLQQFTDIVIKIPRKIRTNEGLTISKTIQEFDAQILCEAKEIH